SQNRFPSLHFDVGAVNDKLSRLFPAGFYYKTFMWPASRWMSYERIIRRVAGLGRVPDGRDPDRYDEHHADADVLVAGGGPAGIAAALAAARSGARVLLADEGSASAAASSARQLRSTARRHRSGWRPRSPSLSRWSTSRCSVVPPSSATTTTISSR